jgi:cation:H+ antiporter
VIAALTFALTGAVIVVAGSRLTVYSDAVAERTGIGGLWVGSVLLAGATSLPELATDVFAVRMGAPDLAVGDLFGSSMANMLILALVDLVLPRQQLLRRVTLDHALAACLAIALTGLATVFVVLRHRPAIGGFAIGPSLLLLFYALGTRAVYRHARRARAESAPEATPARRPGAAGATPTLRRAVVGYLVSAAVILVAAPAFARSAERIAVDTGLGTTFVGAWLVGFATSVPELVTSLTAVRMGAFDMAVGNLFGSNGFNMAIFFALDVAHRGGPLFAAVSEAHVITGVFAMVLTSIGLAALVYRAERRFAMIEPDSLAIVLGYVFGLWMLHQGRAG